MPELILASQSPRRRALLAALGLTFTIDAADVDETPLPGERPDAMVCRLCRAKAQTVAGRHPGALVLAADTVVVLGERLLGKPADDAEAAAMLRSLAGQPHTVFTAVALARNGAVESRLNASQVTMRDYSEAEIAAYVASGDPLDKAGAYAIQHPSFSPVAAWAGCYAGIMGLPLRLTCEMLAEAGLTVPGSAAEVCRGLNGGGCCAVADSRPAAE
jgi:septum formation protein